MITNDPYTIAGAVVAFLLLIALMPLAVIWGWNQLFGVLHTIEYTFWNWLGVLALGLMFNAKVSRSK
jgi:hypothetical protein